MLCYRNDLYSRVLLVEFYQNRSKKLCQIISWNKTPPPSWIFRECERLIYYNFFKDHFSPPPPSHLTRAPTPVNHPNNQNHVVIPSQRFHQAQAAQGNNLHVPLQVSFKTHWCPGRFCELIAHVKIFKMVNLIVHESERKYIIKGLR